MSGVVWGPWFGEYAVAAAAKCYLTKVWTGPKVSDSAQWTGQVQQAPDGSWQVRLGEEVTK